MTETLRQAQQHGQRLDEESCRALLKARCEGRLVYLTGRGERMLPVHYVTTPTHIIIRTAAYNEVTQYAPGNEVLFEVDGTGVSEEAHWTVQVRGTAARLTVAEARLLGMTQEPEIWPAGISTSYIGLPLRVIHGFRRD
ncbi:hypothetical protein JOE57_000043 [Microlunatus panaciterrae]|uniref:Pyridoxamine 5'-phosphate oxidase n=1 Tax=Microlunatus panaciterrae TaxID=400768 RepID=A0ABS2RF05_9ACTN|nr:pyridoxamine 5'-phosphate oxidase family protein [Microlunatus panaciterrae]MBM7797122.1 hypothetical protein [Microlunatus panaciterrae]